MFLLILCRQVECYNNLTGEWRQVPLIVRTPPGSKLGRTTPVTVRVSSDFDTVEVPTTYKTGAALASQ